MRLFLSMVISLIKKRKMHKKEINPNIIKTTNDNVEGKNLKIIKGNQNNENDTFNKSSLFSLHI